MKFKIYKDVSGGYRFKLVARNGEIIAVGEGYSTKENCIKGIKAVKKCSKSKIIDVEGEE